MACKVGPRGSESPRAHAATATRGRREYVLAACMLAVLCVVVLAYFWLTTTPNPAPCELALSVPVHDSVLFTNGTLVDRSHGDVYPPGYHFHYNGTDRGCMCLLKPCIRKCCARDEFIFIRTNASRCEKNPGVSAFDNFTLPVYLNASEFANVSQSHFTILYGDVCTNGKYMLMPHSSPDDKSYLLTDGRVLFAGTYLDPTQYCLEALGHSQAIHTLVCFPPDEDGETRAMFTFYPIGMTLSIPFLFVTFLVYAIIPDLRNLHGKSLMCHVANLLTAYIVLTIVQLGRDAVPAFWCFSLAFVIQFSFLATFFWLNVMCFDIWWVFSGLRPLRGSVKEREHKKFIMYSLYAWGSPLIIFAVTLVMELAPFVPKNFIKPHFGVDKCWFKDPNAQVLYFYLPIGVLILLNIVMFVTTAIRLRAHTKETRVLKSSESSCTDKADRQRFNLYLKLFVVMGINWVMELVSFVVGGPKHLWFVTDIGNTLQGVLIFLIFVWKRRILRMVNQKLCPRWSLVAPPTNSSRSKVSSSSRTSSLTLCKTVSTNPDNMPLKSLSNSGHDDSDPNN